MRTTLDPKLLYHLHIIFESGSLSAAAETLSVSQPTLSRAVSTLESQVGHQLMVLVRLDVPRLPRRRGSVRRLYPRRRGVPRAALQTRRVGASARDGGASRRLRDDRRAQARRRGA